MTIIEIRIVKILVEGALEWVRDHPETPLLDTLEGFEMIMSRELDPAEFKITPKQWQRCLHAAYAEAKGRKK